MKKMHIIWSHPRENSLTASIVQMVKEEGLKNKFVVSELDLYRSDFSPTLLQEDEPDWDNPNKLYSKQVMALANDLNDKDVVVVVFPLWWYSFPAILKGYFDRVWNYGIAYGTKNKLPIKSIRWITLVGGSKENAERRGDDQHIIQFLNDRVASYAGITDSKVEFIYNTIGYEEEIDDKEKTYKAMFQQAKNVVVDLK